MIHRGSQGAESGRKRVLVIGHDAFRAGSQMFLLHVLRWLKGHHSADYSLLLRRGGELLDEYATVLPTRVVPARDVRTGFRSTARRLVHRLLRQRVGLLDSAEPVDLIYANSVPSLDIGLELAARCGCPLICHVHELELAIHRFFSVDRFREAQYGVDAFIAASRVVGTNLVQNHGVDRSRIHLVYEAIGYPIPRLGQESAASLRQTIGIPPEAFVVGGCGTMDLRKAPEVFLQVAHSVREGAVPRPVHFVWVGGEKAGWEREVLDHDVLRMGLAKVVHLVGPQAEPARYFSLFDVFLLTSREDPFPLACLEAAALGIPIICFADAGGMPEFVGEDAGFVVPYLDIGRASDCVRFLMSSESLRLRLGRCAAERAKKHDVAVIAPQIATVLDQYLR